MKEIKTLTKKEIIKIIKNKLNSECEIKYKNTSQQIEFIIDEWEKYI